MKQTHGTASGIKGGWILFFYTVPSKPVSSRMKIWRKLTKAGALQIKGTVYILPFSEDHYEFFQWLVSEVTELKGEAAIVRTEGIDTMDDDEIIAFFNQHRANEYGPLEKSLEELKRKINDIKKGGKGQDIGGLSRQFEKILKTYSEVRAIDFFGSIEGAALKEKISIVKAEIKDLTGKEGKTKRPLSITPKSTDDYQHKIWVTRKRPFVDRMASAWLIKRFIDKNGSFEFIDEKEVGSLKKDAVVFDIYGGEFTHVGDLCTFEVLIKSFALKGGALKKLAEIVHDLDIKDEKYRASEASGLEEILTGIRKTAKNDADALERGMQVFEMLHASKSV